jgi:putative ABC transport system ATP-binding protein
VHLLEALNARGVTLIVVTHDPAIGARARRRLAMEDGAIVRDTRAAEPATSP